MDWPYKEQFRNTEIDKHNGKSMMFNHSEYRPCTYGYRNHLQSDNQVVEFLNGDKVTNLEAELIEQKPNFANGLFTSPTGDLALNTAWLFTQVPELLETHQVKTTHKYNKTSMKKEKVYWLDPVGDLCDY